MMERTAWTAPWTGRRWVSFLLAAVVGGVSWLGGCARDGGGDRATDASTTLRDSAGVTIAETSGPVWNTPDRWHVGEGPVLRIGSVEGDAHDLLDGVRGALVLEDGRIVVANGGTNTVRWYDGAGRFLFERGGEGEGPGEFTRMMGMTRHTGDTVVVIDGSAWRITVFDPAGELAEVERVEGMLAPPGAAYRLTDGSFVVGSAGFSSRQLGDEREAGLRRYPTPLLRIHAGASPPDTIGVFPGREMYFFTIDGNFAFGGHPFGRGFFYAAHGDLVWVGTTEGFRVDGHAPDGSLLRSVRVTGEDLTLGPGAVEAYGEQSLERYEGDPEGRRRAEDRLAEMPIPAERPAYDALVVGHAGELWLGEHVTGSGTATRPTRGYGGGAEGEESTRGRRWAVFDPEGRFLGTVTLPPEFRPTDVHGDFVLGRSTDEFGVEYVVGYAIGPVG